MANGKLRQKPCAHTKQKHKHMASKTKSPPMFKPGHEHAANENTHKPRVHTRHDNIRARSQWKTQAACHTAQDITWMHEADKNTNCVQHHKTQHMWTDKSAGLNKLETARSHNDTWSTSVQTPSRNRNSRHECRDPNTILQDEIRHAVESPVFVSCLHVSARLRVCLSHALTWRQDVKGVSGLGHKTHEWH